ncbi:conserved hypothetical protein [Gluconacetobacter diazotrophicus PA1 5]|uniref:Uncharacterized protein n=2 Tax=Gluconacetobacter diazotrophicus TaxID=33996 RepID=A9H420_GLUDA|nr:hypothetical protein [Gluconacetobacter diazotrophicus]ACI52659.1 conserved hypothetical protein [Gluconacetobacter diazotrophicus PA1 5]MBB2156412.1 hypothetical protein [Gluconacetobacter diazotrophicus]TWB06066.1 hypothetical protein FBZ86_11356 [Gluconacetobacter diazotrophicus]CAP57388.1 conserved hypothetical protein [Gluconacetobacter diazotrophicus PA1 5]
MIEPVPSSVEQCPFCHRTIRGTTETCPHCGAERQFGPTRRESLASIGFGVVVGPAGMALAGAGITLALMAAAIGGVLGFFVAHSRHAGDRWMPPRKAR